MPVLKDEHSVSSRNSPVASAMTLSPGRDNTQASSPIVPLTPTPRLGSEEPSLETQTHPADTSNNIEGNQGGNAPSNEHTQGSMAGGNALATEPPTSATLGRRMSVDALRKLSHQAFMALVMNTTS